MMFSQRGFTLIELSIVLVIIGLIVGGILVGRDLIRAATLRTVVTQIEQFNTAVNAFKLKYNCLPGDCAAAAAFGFDPTTAGTGNQIIGGEIAGLPVEESVNFWYHLSAANLIPFTGSPYQTGPCCYAGTASPETKLAAVHRTGNQPTKYGWAVAAKVLFDPSAGGGIMEAHAFLLQTQAVVNQFSWGDYYPADMHALDEKIDDAGPVSGTMRAWNSNALESVIPLLMRYSVAAGAGGPTAAVCVRTDTATPQYNVLYTTPGAVMNPGLCAPMIKAAF